MQSRHGVHSYAIWSFDFGTRMESLFPWPDYNLIEDLRIGTP